MMHRRNESENSEEDDKESSSNKSSSNDEKKGKGKIASGNNPRKEKRRVHWKPTAKVILIPKREEYINAGLGSTLWWEGLDYASFRHSTADELARCMKYLKIGGREAMTVLYQSGCPKFQSTVFENLVIAIPQRDVKENSYVSPGKKSKYKQETQHVVRVETFHSIVQLACLISAIERRTDSSDDLKDIYVRSSSSLLFEEVLNSDSIESSLPLSQNTTIQVSDAGRDRSCSICDVSAAELPGTYSNQEDVSGMMSENAIRYPGKVSPTLKNSCKSPLNNPVFSSRRSAEYPSLPLTWEEAVSGEEWRNRSFVITEDHPPFTIVYCNKSWEHLTGFAEKDFLGKDFRIMHGPLTQKSKLRRIGKAIQQMRAEREAEKKKPSWLTNPPPRQLLKVSIINYTKKGSAFNMILLMGFIEKRDANCTTDHTFILATSLNCMLVEELANTA